MSIFDKIKDAFDGKSDEEKRAEELAKQAEQAATDAPTFDPNFDTVPDTTTSTTTTDATGMPFDIAPESVAHDGGLAPEQGGEIVEDIRSGELTTEAQAPLESPAAEAAPATPAFDTPAAPAPEAAPAPAAAPEAAAPAPQTYTVEEGDNLSWIGERYGVSVQQLVDANGIENPDLIFPGQVLTIPNA